MCTFKNVVKNVEVKVDVQMGALGCRAKIDNGYVGSIQFTFLSSVYQMVTILNHHLVHSCWGLHLGSRFLQTRGSWAPLSFALWIVAKLLYSCLCLLDVIVELHAMDEKMFNDFLLESESGFICNKCLFNLKFNIFYM